MNSMQKDDGGIALSRPDFHSDTHCTPPEQLTAESVLLALRQHSIECPIPGTDIKFSHFNKNCIEALALIHQYTEQECAKERSIDAKNYKFAFDEYKQAQRDNAEFKKLKAYYSEIVAFLGHDLAINEIKLGRSNFDKHEQEITRLHVEIARLRQALYKLHTVLKDYYGDFK